MEIPPTNLSLEAVAKFLQQSHMPPLPDVDGITLPGYEKPYHQPFTSSDRVTSRNAERVSHLLKVLPDTLEVDTLADLGAGNSEITDEISKAYSVSTAYACDVYSKEEFIPPTTDSKVVYREVNNDLVPIDDNSIDLVTAFMSIHHFSQPDKIISEVKRILKPGKWFFFREHDVTTMKQIHQLNRVHDKYAAKNGVNRKHHMIGKTRYWGRQELKRFLERNGFCYVASSEYEKDSNPQAIYHSLFQIQK